MDNRPDDERLGEAFQRLGENLQSLVQQAWASDTRRQLQQELETGLSQLERSVRDLASEVADSQPGRRAQEQVDALQGKIESGELEDQARQQLLKALARINAELESTVERWRASADRSEPPAGSS